MQVFYENSTDTETISTLTGAGLDVAIPDDDMADEDYLEVVMASDTLLVHGPTTPRAGFLIGLAMAFGKAVYVFDHVQAQAFHFQGYHHHTDLEDALKALLEDHDGNHELERGGSSTGGDSTPGGDPSDVPGV
jgi:hypothetical protein